MQFFQLQPIIYCEWENPCTEFALIDGFLGVKLGEQLWRGSFAGLVFSIWYFIEESVVVLG